MMSAPRPTLAQETEQRQKRSDSNITAQLSLRVHQNLECMSLHAQIKGFAPFRNRHNRRDQVIEPNPTLSQNIHHAIPCSGGVADGSLQCQLLIEKLIDRKLHFATANSNLCVFAQRP